TVDCLAEGSEDLSPPLSPRSPLSSLPSPPFHSLLFPFSLLALCSPPSMFLPPSLPNACVYSHLFQPVASRERDSSRKVPSFFLLICHNIPTRNNHECHPRTIPLVQSLPTKQQVGG